MLRIAMIGIAGVLLALQVKALKPEYGIYLCLAVSLLVFASDLCKDAGYATIAGQIQMFGKLSVLAAGIPVLTALLETIRGFLS